MPTQPSHHPTSLTLLARLRDPADAAAWREFDGRYRELIVWFLRRRGLQVADAEDAAQQVIAKLVRGLQSFEYDRSKRGFRAYLYRCTRSVLSDHFSRQAARMESVSLHGEHIGDHPDSAGDSENEAFAAFEQEWIDHHYRLAVQRYRKSANPRSVAVLEATMAGRGAQLIAAELDMSDAAVHKAQQRLRERLKELIAEQLHDEEVGHERPGK